MSHPRAYQGPLVPSEGVFHDWSDTCGTFFGLHYTAHPKTRGTLFLFIPYLDLYTKHNFQACRMYVCIPAMRYPPRISRADRYQAQHPTWLQRRFTESPVQVSPVFSLSPPPLSLSKPFTQLQISRNLYIPLHSSDLYSRASRAERRDEVFKNCPASKNGRGCSSTCNNS